MAEKTGVQSVERIFQLIEQLGAMWRRTTRTATTG